MYFSTNALKLKTLYTAGIYLANLVLKSIAPFNPKIKLGVVGRATCFKILESQLSKSDKTLWFHCASLGEYEQGLPVFKALREDYPQHKIVLSFFSPSGYEIKKNSPIADVVVYLPLDTISHANRFLDLVHPDLSIFVKYEIWPNLLNSMKARGVRAILISAAFRETHSFFKWYGRQTRDALFAFEHIFTQNTVSKQLLERINYKAVTVSGDTRFDRVLQQLDQDNTIDFIAQFKQKQLCMVIGSSWPEDEKLLVAYINKLAAADTKFIIAPHNIKPAQIQALKVSIKRSCLLYSEKEGHELSDYQVLILDTIGLLSRVYAYADLAYIGGAMGHTGLHNTLEAAVFGVPIIIGPNHKKFPEAQAMLNIGGLFSVNGQDELDQTLKTLETDKALRLELGQKNADYILKHQGAVAQILKFLRR